MRVHRGCYNWPPEPVSGFKTGFLLDCCCCCCWRSCVKEMLKNKHDSEQNSTHKRMLDRPWTWIRIFFSQFFSVLRIFCAKLAVCAVVRRQTFLFAKQINIESDKHPFRMEPNDKHSMMAHIMGMNINDCYDFFKCIMSRYKKYN